MVAASRGCWVLRVRSGVMMKAGLSGRRRDATPTQGCLVVLRLWMQGIGWRRMLVLVDDLLLLVADLRLRRLLLKLILILLTVLLIQCVLS